MKVAAIDLGSNSIHMVIVEISASGGFQVVDREKQMVRLGAGTLARGRLSAAAIKRGLAALVEYKRLADSHGVDKIIAVATSAIREASNGEDFLEQVGGIDPEGPILDAYRASDATNLLDATLDVDVRTYLPNDLLVKVNITSMANSVEIRCPFLDHPLMEFAASLPPSLKIRGLKKSIFSSGRWLSSCPRRFSIAPSKGSPCPSTNGSVMT